MVIIEVLLSIKNCLSKDFGNQRIEISMDFINLVSTVKEYSFFHLGGSSWDCKVYNFLLWELCFLTF